MAKKKIQKARSLITMNMLLTCKGGQHRDQKAHEKRNACRGKVQQED